MRMHSTGSITAAVLGMVFVVVSLAPSLAGAADTASGSLVYKGKTLELKYVYLVKGPDYTSTVIRELVFSPTDIGAKVQACGDLSCVSGKLDEGLTVDFDSGPRLNIWLVMNGQMVQYSGTADLSAFTATADEPGRLAGVLKMDPLSADGGTLDVTFDATVAKEFK